MKEEDVANLVDGLKKLANFRKSTGINTLDIY